MAKYTVSTIIIKLIHVPYFTWKAEFYLPVSFSYDPSCPETDL